MSYFGLVDVSQKFVQDEEDVEVQDLEDDSEVELEDVTNEHQ